MIKRVEIEDFKCLHQENLEFKPLTIITGLNSTGKSSLIQAILLPFIITSRFVNDVMNPSFEAIRNKYQNAKEVKFSLFFGGTALEFNHTEDESPWTRFTGIDSSENFPFDIERNIFYLSANRMGTALYSPIHPEYKVGSRGEFLLGTFEKEKSTPIITELIKDKTSYTLSTQVNYWLSYILDISTELQSEKRLENQVEAKYNSDGLQNISPLQLGAGVGYLTKILIMCLRAKKGDILIIENPEIHLHPASQAKVGEFFAFIANAGIQVIIETHCEHLILKIGYEIYKKRYSNEDVTILYKGGIQTPFEVIDYKDDGKFKTDFPEGFFDATLSELLEME